MFLLILAQFFLSTSQAGDRLPTRVIEEVQTDQIMVLGQALENRETGEQLALTCTDPVNDRNSCKNFRFALIRHSAAFLFGPPMSVAKEEELSDALKSTYKKLKKQIRNERRSENGAVASVMIVIGVGTAATVVLVSAIPTVGLAPLTAIWFAMNVGSYVGRQVDFVGSSAGRLSTKDIQLTRTAEGWNWSTRPEIISHRKFYFYKLAIENLNREPVDLKFNMIPAREGQCKVALAPSGDLPNYFYPRERLLGINRMMVASEMAKSLGCAFTPRDRNAQFTLAIDSNDRTGNERKTSFKITDSITGEVKASEERSEKGWNPVRNDRQFNERSPE